MLLDSLRSPSTLASILLSALVVLAGCADSGDENREADSGASISGLSGAADADARPRDDGPFRYLQEVDERAMREAFAGLNQKVYTRRMLTEQFDAGGRRIAFEERTVRFAGPPEARETRVLDAESSGTFDYGYLAGFVPREPETAEAVDIVADVLPDDPAYLSERNRDAFFYRMLRDTTIQGAIADVVEVRARPGEGDDSAIRSMRLYVLQQGQRLVAVRLERTDRAVWFRERSRFYLEIGSSPSGGWMPSITQTETLIKMPFREEQRFRTVSTYEEG